MRNADTLEVTTGGHTQTVNVLRGTLEVAASHLSYINVDDEPGARVYVALHAVDRWRYVDHSREGR
jgi:hypothetical protein